MEVRHPLTEVSNSQANTTGVSLLSEDDKLRFNKYLQKGRALIENKDLVLAWKAYSRAHKLVPSEKLLNKMNKIEVALKKNDMWPEEYDKYSSPTDKVKSSQSPLEETNGSEDVPDTTEDGSTNYNVLIEKATLFSQDRKYYDAYQLYKEAYALHASEKLAKKLKKMEVYLEEHNLLPLTKPIEDITSPVKTLFSDDVRNKTGETKENIEEDESHKQAAFKEYVAEAKGLKESGDIEGSLALYKKACLLYPGEKLQKRIAKMEEYLQQHKAAEITHEESNSADPNNESNTSKKDIENSVSAENDTELRDKYQQCIVSAKSCLSNEDVKGALKFYKEAHSLHQTEKMEKKIAKMEAYIRENADEEKESKQMETEHENSEQQMNESKDESKITVSSVVSPPRSTPGTSIRNESTDSPSLSDVQYKFIRLTRKAKEAADNEDVKLSLELYKKAYKLNPTEKVKARIKKLESFIARYGDDKSDSDEGAGDDMVHMGNGYYLYKDLFNNLYAHQREGLLWMWNLYKQKKGGILGDDMGLGKTIQVISFLSGMFDAEKIKAVLIVLPVAVIVNWEREFDTWAPGISVNAFHTDSKKQRERILQKTARKGGVVMTSYGMLVRPQNTRMLTEINGRDFTWDYVILDEGHKIKNPSNKCAKGVHSIPARNRLIMTGTPVQNNLKEMWTLFDWTHQGSLLGTAKTFGMQYEQPIMRARQKDATVGEQRLGHEMATSLKKLISPFFLRRTKAEVAKKEKQKKGNENGDDQTDGKNDKGHTPAMPTLSRKNDLICWVFLSNTQQRIYEDFISQDDVKQLLNSSRSPLTALTALKKICDHPRLMTNAQCLQLGLHMDEGIENAEVLDDETSKESAVARIDKIPDHILIDESGKLMFLVELLDNLKAEGHRCLLFSQSRKMLDIIEKVMKKRGHKVARLDGTIKHLSEREDIIQRFSRDKSYSLFLLTTQVGGVGLTLTAADRVVIYDPSWNPATDAQAVDRAFRIGQTKDVVIYRLITCGSVEEKIYRRQIFKDSITKQTTGESKNPYRYFSKQDLHELFVLDNPKSSNTQMQLNSLHGGQRKTDTTLDHHIAYLHTLDMFGISDHDLMFNKEAVDEEDEDYNPENDYVQNRVEQAQRLIGLEAEENLNQVQMTGKYSAPEVFAAKEPVKRIVRSPEEGGITMPVIIPNKRNRVDTISDSDSDSESLNKSMGNLGLQSGNENHTPDSNSFAATNRTDSGGGTAQSHLEHMVVPGLSEDEQLQLALKMSEESAQAEASFKEMKDKSPVNAVTASSNLIVQKDATAMETRIDSESDENEMEMDVSKSGPSNSSLKQSHSKVGNEVKSPKINIIDSDADESEANSSSNKSQNSIVSLSESVNAITNKVLKKKRKVIDSDDENMDSIENNSDTSLRDSTSGSRDIVESQLKSKNKIDSDSEDSDASLGDSTGGSKDKVEIKIKRKNTIDSDSDENEDIQNVNKSGNFSSNKIDEYDMDTSMSDNKEEQPSDKIQNGAKLSVIDSDNENVIPVDKTNSASKTDTSYTKKSLVVLDSNDDTDIIGKTASAQGKSTVKPVVLDSDTEGEMISANSSMTDVHTSENIVKKDNGVNLSSNAETSSHDKSSEKDLQLPAGDEKMDTGLSGNQTKKTNETKPFNNSIFSTLDSDSDESSKAVESVQNDSLKKDSHPSFTDKKSSKDASLDLSDSDEDQNEFVELPSINLERNEKKSLADASGIYADSSESSSEEEKYTDSDDSVDEKCDKLDDLDSESDVNDHEEDEVNKDSEENPIDRSVHTVMDIDDADIGTPVRHLSGRGNDVVGSEKKKVISSTTPMNNLNKEKQIRARTPGQTPSSKRRRSVNVGLTPHKEFLNQSIDSGVVKEELIFSPRAAEPEVSFKKVDDRCLSESAENPGYQTFIAQMASEANPNSTAIFGASAKSSPAEGEKESPTTAIIEESEEESEEEELTEEEIQNYNRLLQESKKFYKEGELKKALASVIKAVGIYNEDESVQKFALRIRNKLAR